MEQAECSETLATKFHTPENIPKENIRNCTLLHYYAASNGNLLQTFRDNLSVPSSGCKNHTLVSFPVVLGKTVFLDRPQEAESGWEICDG
jgi:hypothetical protein